MNEKQFTGEYELLKFNIIFHKQLIWSFLQVFRLASSFENACMPQPIKLIEPWSENESFTLSPSENLILFTTEINEISSLKTWEKKINVTVL